MKNAFVLVMSLIAVGLGITPAAAKPADIGLNFDLAPSPESKPVVAQAQEPAETPDKPDQPEAKPLPLPDRAAEIPSGTRSNKPNIVAELPPPPAPAVEVPAADPPPAAPSPEPSPIDITPAAQAPTQTSLNTLFQGDDNSLVARSVGSAEGTRTPSGDRTPAYGGHVDPGNGAWNLGTFSYQHGADSPEAADRQQLARLSSQAEKLREQAAASNLSLTIEEELNGIDLANQSPRAALSPGGYIDRLRQAHDMGLQGSDAVLWARTRAFLDPNTNRWNAPGLGNTIGSITADQDRRRQAIAQAIEAQPQIATSDQQTASLPIARREETTVDPESIANLIISLDLPPT